MTITVFPLNELSVKTVKAAEGTSDKKSDGIIDDNKLYFDQIMPDDKMSDINIPENMYS